MYDVITEAVTVLEGVPEDLSPAQVWSTISWLLKLLVWKAETDGIRKNVMHCTLSTNCYHLTPCTNSGVYMPSAKISSLWGLQPWTPEAEDRRSFDYIKVMLWQRLLSPCWVLQHWCFCSHDCRKTLGSSQIFLSFMMQVQPWNGMSSHNPCLLSDGLVYVTVSLTSPIQYTFTVWYQIQILFFFFSSLGLSTKQKIS